MSTPMGITITLRAAAKAHSYMEPDTGAFVLVDCPHCHLGLDDGDPIVNHRGYGWVHLSCLVERIQDMEADTAWLTLAEQIASGPSRYRAAEIRAVVQNIIRIARRTVGG